MLSKCNEGLLMIKHILFACDLGPFTPFALKYVEFLAVELDAKVLIVHAVPPIADLTQAVLHSYCSEQVKSELLGVSDICGIHDVLRDQVFDVISQSCDDTSTLLDHIIDIVIATGNPAEVILGEAAHACSDVIIIGSHGPNAVDKHIIGSVASKVLQLSKTPVFMLPMLRPRENNYLENQVFFKV